MRESLTTTGGDTKAFYRNADWLLLIFLFFFTNQSNFSLKLAGLLFIFIARPNFKLGVFKGRIPLFYPMIIALAIVNAIFRATELPTAYLSALAVACFFWIAAMLGYHQVRLSIERNSFRKTDNTFRVFTLLNLMACVVQLVRIMLKTHKLNPFRGLDFPYGMSTGDKMFGFFLENSYYNMMVSSFLVVYFLYRRNLPFCLIAMLTLSIVFGNTGNFFFILVLIAIFTAALLQSVLKGRLKDSGARQSQGLLTRLSPGSKSLIFIPVLIGWCVVIYLSISPENFNYLIERTPLKKAGGQALRLPKTNASNQADTGQYVDITAAANRLNFVKYGKSGDRDTADAAYRKLITGYAVQHMQGKKLSLLETYQYLRASPLNLLMGAGAGRFSSGTAHRVSGMDSSRIFMRYVPHYAAPAYRENHMLLAKYRLLATEEYYSNANWPESFYNQLFGEYGLLGVLLFLVFYVGYFLRKHRRLSWGWWLTLMAGAYAFLAYLFDTLCIMVFYELLMLHDLKRGEEQEKEAQVT